MNKLLSIGLISSLMLACSSQTLTKVQRNLAYQNFIQSADLSSVKKIRSFKFDDWKSLSDNYLILTAAHKKDHLIKLKKRCLGLSSTLNIRLNQFGSATLSSNIDAITVLNNESINFKCYIDLIFPLTPAQARQLVSIGKASAAPQTKPPE